MLGCKTCFVSGAGRVYHTLFPDTMYFLVNTMRKIEFRPNYSNYANIKLKVSVIHPSYMGSNISPSMLSISSMEITAPLVKSKIFPYSSIFLTAPITVI